MEQRPQIEAVEMSPTRCCCRCWVRENTGFNRTPEFYHITENSRYTGLKNRGKLTE
jgi:hypothetical protein